MQNADRFEVYMLSLINAHRAELGLAALRLEKNLNQSAHNHSLWMLNTNTFSHTGVGGSSEWDRMQDAGFDPNGVQRYTENIAIQPEGDAAGIMDDVYDLHMEFMNSPSHYANLINPNMEFIGIGIVTGSYNYGPRAAPSVAVTQNFAQTNGTVDLDPANSTIKYGTTGDDNFAATAAADDINGFAGNDVIFGLAGNDDIRGGAGNDRLLGQFGQDTLLGEAGNDQLFGHAGQDVLRGGAGDDTLLGGDDNDQLFGGDNNDRAFGQFGNDLMRGGNGNDSLFGGLGNDTLYGEAGDDVVSGDNGEDILYGLDGDDRMNGNNGWDRMYGGNGADRMSGELGNDKIYGGAGWDTVWAGEGNDELYGELGNDRLIGGNGFDKLYGGDGNDALNGGALFDQMWGGDGADTFIFTRGNKYDVVMDFALGTDKLDLRGMGFNTLQEVMATASQDGARVDFTFGDGDVLRVWNATETALSADILF